MPAAPAVDVRNAQGWIDDRVLKLVAASASAAASRHVLTLAHAQKLDVQMSINAKL